MLSQVLIKQYELNLFTVLKNVEGISEEEARQTPTGSSSMNWILGHLAYARNGVHGYLGLEPAFPAELAAAYANGTAPSTDAPCEVGQLVGFLQASQEALSAHLAKVGDSGLEGHSPEPFVVTGSTSVALNAGALAFHESYHCGQLGVLRRALGKGAGIVLE